MLSLTIVKGGEIRVLRQTIKLGPYLQERVLLIIIPFDPIAIFYKVFGDGRFEDRPENF